MCQQESAKEFRNAQLLYDLQQVNFVVQIDLCLVENLLLARLLSLFSAATAVNPTATAVDLLPEPVNIGLRVEIAENTTGRYGVFYFLLIGVHVLVKFVVNFLGFFLFILATVFPGIKLFNQRFVD